MKPFLFLCLTALSLFAYNDADLDGVDDAYDRCPNTPFGDLADSTGCTTRTLFTQNAYDIIIGAVYSDTNYNTFANAKTLTTTLQADYYRGSLSAQLLSSYFDSEDSVYDDRGFNDTQLTFFYKLNPLPELTLQSGIGVILPTYKSGYGNEAADWIGLINAQYNFDSSFNLFGGYSYTLVNDSDIENIASYQNTSSFYAGIGYSSHHSGYIKVSYGQSQSIFKEIEPIRTLALNGMIPLDSHWFMLGDYRYGLSDSASDHEVALRIGYYF